MTDSKEIENLKADLELVSKTAKALADKLEKVFLKFEQISASIEGVTTPQSTSKEVTSTKPTQIPSQTPVSSSQTASTGESTKAGRILDSFLNQVQSMTKGSEISDLLSRLRDQVMQSAEVGFHPAFHEMGRYANQIKNINEISAEEKEQLLEKVYDWKARLTS